MLFAAGKGLLDDVELERIPFIEGCIREKINNLPDWRRRVQRDAKLAKEDWSLLQECIEGVLAREREHGNA